MVRVGIIGTACRDGDFVSGESYYRALLYIERWLELQWPWSEITLVSGGAAWSDHLAVLLYLRHSKSRIDLKLPEPLSVTCDTNTRSTSWYHHQRFQQSTKIPSLSHLSLIPSDYLTIYNGFKDRDRGIATSVDLLIALTKDPNGKLTSGTRYTWNYTPSGIPKYVVSYR